MLLYCPCFLSSFKLVIVCGIVEWIKYTTPIYNITWMRISWLKSMENVIVLRASWLKSMENVIVLRASWLESMENVIVLRASWLESMENVIVLRASWLVSMENVIVLPGWKQLATAASEKTVDIHGFITITRSISLISMCLLLSLGRYLGYPCVYYYH